MKRIKKLLRNFSFRKRNIIVGKRTDISLDSIIGNYTYIGKNCNITKSNIGRYCSIANNVTIGAGEHIATEISTSSLFYENPYLILTKNECELGNDVWVGTNSIIRRGVIIGNGAIIGANSFVNKDVPAFGIVVGSPAKLLRYRFSNSIIDAIIKSKWWDLNFQLASEKIIGLRKKL